MVPLAVSTMLAVFVVVPLVVLWIVGVVDIVRRDLPLQAKAAWITIVLLLPVVGVVGYFLLRKPTQEEGRLRRAATSELHGVAPDGDIGPRPPVD
jgi:hypothetical protein